MRGNVDVFQLMAGKFIDNQGVPIDLVAEVKGGNPDIPHEQAVGMGFLQDVVGERGRSALPLGSSDTDDLF